MSNYKDVVATIGEYEKDGQRKYITRKVGTLLETQHGLRLKLDACFNPAGCKVDDNGSVWLACFDPKPKEEYQARQAPQRDGIVPVPTRPAKPEQGRYDESGSPGYDDFDSAPF